MTDKLLSVKAVADLLSVHPQTVWKWVRQGRLPKPIYISRKLPRWQANAGLIPDALLPTSADSAGLQSNDGNP